MISQQDVVGSMTQHIGAFIVAIAGIAMAAQHYIMKWKSNSAESSILKLLTEELTRMSTQNKLLTEYVHSLQLEAVKISSELTKLHIENGVLNERVVSLTKQISLLQSTLCLTAGGVVQ